MTRDQELALKAAETARELAARARKWPEWWRVERDVKRILECHPDFRTGEVTALRLFKAYRLALRRRQAMSTQE